MKKQTVYIFKNNVKLFDASWKFDTEEASKYESVINPNLTDADNYSQPSAIAKNGEGATENEYRLDSALDNVKIRGTLSNVVIKYTPPEFVKTDIDFDKTYNPYDFEDEDDIKVTHDCKIYYKDKFGLDVKSVIVIIGNADYLDVAEKNGGENGFIYLYKYIRKDGDTEPTKFSDRLTDLAINSGKDSQYVLSFTLDTLLKKLETPVEEYTTYLEAINGLHLSIRIYDVAGNHYDYTIMDSFSEVPITSDNLQKILIDFSNENPKDRIVTETNRGEVMVTCTNPNTEWWAVPIYAELDKSSVGNIKEGSMSYDYDLGILTFYVENINATGNVIVNAWLEFNNDEMHDLVKTATYNTAMEKWICTDPEGRLIHLKPFVPKYLKDNAIYDFIVLTETWLNTMYESLSDNRISIGVLEKIARINDFHDIDRVETPYLLNYSRHYGNELQFEYDKLSGLIESAKFGENTNNEVTNTIGDLYKNNSATPMLMMASATNTTTTAQKSNGKSGIGYAVVKLTANTDLESSLTDAELNHIIRSIYKQIPYYNQWKGTYTGMNMILMMFGMCCKIINIWMNIDETEAQMYNEDGSFADTQMFREDELESYIGKFLTPRFDLDIEQTSLTLYQFNKLVDSIVRMISSIKPVTRILNKIKYYLIFRQDMVIEHNLDIQVDKRDDFVFRYDWVKANGISFKTSMCKASLCLSYYPSSAENFTKLPSGVTNYNYMYGIPMNLMGMVHSLNDRLIMNSRYIYVYGTKADGSIVSMKLDLEDKTDKTIVKNESDKFVITGEGKIPTLIYTTFNECKTISIYIRFLPNTDIIEFANKDDI